MKINKDQLIADSKLIDELSNYNDSYSAGSPGGGGISSMGGHTNKGLTKLPEGYHEKAKQHAIDNLTKKDRSYSSAKDYAKSCLNR